MDHPLPPAHTRRDQPTTSEKTRKRRDHSWCLPLQLAAQYVTDCARTASRKRPLRVIVTHVTHSSWPARRVWSSAEVSAVPLPGDPHAPQLDGVDHLRVEALTAPSLGERTRVPSHERPAELRLGHALEHVGREEIGRRASATPRSDHPDRSGPRHAQACSPRSLAAMGSRARRRAAVRQAFDCAASAIAPAAAEPGARST